MREGEDALAGADISRRALLGAGLGWLGGLWALGAAAHQAPAGKKPSRGQHEAVGLISHIAPIYLVYDSSLYVPGGRGLANERSERRVAYAPSGPEARYARMLGKEIERVFGHRALPVEWAEVRLPDLHLDEVGIGEARLIDCLLTPDRW